MLLETVNLRKDDNDITLTAFVADNKSFVRDALLVIPGGGYNIVCNEREGEPVALEFLARGYNAFVLKYSVGEKAKNLNPLTDASLGTMWHLDEIYKRTGIERGVNKPTGVILCYPVISGGINAHKGSFYKLCGTDTPSDEELEFYSIEKRIDEKSSPAFLYHTYNDNIVPCQNSIIAALAYRNAGIMCELHIFPDAPHGASLGNRITSFGNSAFEDASIALWPTLADNWMKQI